MSRSFFPNSTGVMSLLIPTLGLLVAAAFIFIALFSIIFANPLHDKIELQNIANTFTTHLQAIDAYMIETKTIFLFPAETTTLQFFLSPASLSITNQDSVEPIVFNQILITHPWIRTSDDPWMTTEEFHTYLFMTFGSTGVQLDPLPYTENLQNILQNEWNQSYDTYTYNPYQIDPKDPIIIEKCILYLDKNNDGIWEKTDGKQEYLLIYQE